MTPLSNLYSQVFFFASFLWTALVWIGLKQLAVRRDWPRLWDSSEAAAAIVGTLIMAPTFVAKWPSWVQNRPLLILYYALTFWVGFTLFFMILSMGWEKELAYPVPKSLEPLERRVRR